MTRSLQHNDKRVEELRKIAEPIIDKCRTEIEGKPYLCSRSDGEGCRAYAFPAAKWRIGDCPLADEPLRSEDAHKTSGKVRVGQQKQKKKSRR